MTQHTAYSFADVAATINGRAVTGLFEGDNAVEVAPMSDRSAMVVGVDGSSITSRSTNQAATITLRLQHTSPTHRYLSQLDRRAAAGGSVFFPMTVKDTGSGEGGAAEKVSIRTAPTLAKGQNATVREWVLHTGEWQPTIPLEVQ